MDLGNEKADAELSKFADEIQKRIVASDDNDAIFDDLELLEEFVYKVPKQTVAIAQHIFSHPHKPKTRKILDGAMEGKRHEKIADKILELLNRIRYIAPSEIFPILAEIIRTEDGDGKAKAMEVLKGFSKYDFNLLKNTKAGYTPQRMILDFIEAWTPEQQLANFEFVQIVTTELLGSAVSGTSADSVDTITFPFWGCSSYSIFEKTSPGGY